jgi:rhodanese-related sulfurtransferase
MKFLIDNWMLLTVALASGGMLMWPALQGATMQGLTPNNAVLLINRERAVIVDVREPDEYAAGHLPGARNVPLAQLEQRLPELVKNKGLPLVMVCGSGGRAGRAVPIAKRLGYSQAQVLAGGLKAWKEANLPVDKA